MASSRMSTYSLASDGPGSSRGAGKQSAQVSTTSLLNAVHNIYLSSQAYRLDAGSSLVVNTWLTSTHSTSDGKVGGTVDAALAVRAWEHARRRAEDGCIVLASLHHSTPSVLVPFLSTVPLSIPTSLFRALEAIEPFLRCVTPYNPSTPRHAALGVTLTLDLAGNLTAAHLALSEAGIDTKMGFLSIPAEAGYRAFDVFYYLLTSASTPAEREFLGLKPASSYRLLSRSGTYDPPNYLPTADDAAAADDFRSALKEIGIKGSAHRSLVSTLAGLLKLGDTVDYLVDEEELEEVCEDVSGLLGMEPETLAHQCTTEDRSIFIGGLYEALVDWVISKANDAIKAQLIRDRDGDDSDGGRGTKTPNTNEETGDTVSITVIDIPDPSLGKAVAMRGIFDDSLGINAEMRQDSLDVTAPASTVLKDMEQAVADAGPELGAVAGSSSREHQRLLEKREGILEKIGYSVDHEGFLRKLLFPIEGAGINLGRKGRLNLLGVLGSSRVWYHLSLHPTDDSLAQLAALPSVNSAWSAGTVSRQLRAWRLSEWANRRNKLLDFTADFDFDEFVQRYQALGCKDGRDGIESWIMERGWSNGEVMIGTDRVWMRENAWWEAESMLDVKPLGGHLHLPGMGNVLVTGGLESGYSANGSGYFPQSAADLTPTGSHDQLLHQGQFLQPNFPHNAMPTPSIAPTDTRQAPTGDYGLGVKGDTHKAQLYYGNDGEFVGNLDPEIASGKLVEERPISTGRRIWVFCVWALTFWIPSPLLRYIGRMKRPDVRMAWREKLVLCFLIFLINAAIVFWIIFFGRLLCPNFDKAWSQNEVATHQGADDFWVSIHGKVYDISKFWRIPHGDSNIETSSDLMQPFAGMNLDEYFVAPLPLSCPGFDLPDYLQLQFNSTPTHPEGLHISGHYASDPTSKLASPTWYVDDFLPRIKEYYHGDLVWSVSDVKSDGVNNNHQWFLFEGGVYDLTDYFFTQKYNRGLAMYSWLNSDLTNAVKNNPGQDMTDLWHSIIKSARSNDTLNASVQNSITCIKNTFYIGVSDFRQSARCQVNNYILLAFTIILCAVILIKFISALQFGSKRRPAPQDKFVICQVPAYTEGEDSLRKALDSLTALEYDNKRKLICVICDGVIVGEGNDRPTPKIVLDILGVDPKVDPPALPFKSVGAGSDQLNYGKVYSGLYEYEGNVVPYIVVVKVGKESEQSKAKPGNRGKRDSQILLMSFLNRVHHRSPMNPLELEMFHQINNIIGVDPELYEYLLMVDADTSVREDSLNRLVAACANDAKIAGICGETSLQNEERSWWTMIQVYEYFISHHMAKAFESLFGSVTCLPGCFSMYRLRTAEKGKPLIISDDVIREYSDCHVDTLHKKNLLSLGEDRYLTTLMTKYFPFMSYKFIADAYCQTAAPEKWSVLLSQRRRWINSTIHNLAELMWLKEMCGFCCFSMRFIVFIDLCGTIILPATCVYLGYVVYVAATHQGQFPLISIIMLAAVYGLQALIFILKRQWQHVGWMIIYIIAFPVYSFILPIYSFWNQDNFSWGNTRIVIGETGKKQIVAVDAETFDPRSIPLQRWDDYAVANNLPGGRGLNAEKSGNDIAVYDQNYEMDDMKSVYSSIRQPSVFTGLPGGGPNAFMTPQSQTPSPIGGQVGFGRNSTYTGVLPYNDGGLAQRHLSMVSVGGVGAFGQDILRTQSPYQDNPSLANAGPYGHDFRPSMSNLRLSTASPAIPRGSTINLGYAGGVRPPLGDARQSTISFDFQRGAAAGPDDSTIIEATQAVLREVDLDHVTKKQVRALVEQRLQTELVGERRTFMDRQIDNELANM